LQVHFFRPRKRESLLGFLKQNGWHVRMLYDAVKVTKEIKRIVLDAKTNHWKANAILFAEKGVEVFLLTDEEVSPEELREAGIAVTLPSNEQFCQWYTAGVQGEKKGMDPPPATESLFVPGIPLSQRMKKEAEEQRSGQQKTESDFDKTVEMSTEPHLIERGEQDPIFGKVVMSRDINKPLPSAITVYGAKGGVGKTVFLLNLASTLTKHGVKVCILDLDIYHGTVAATLQIHPEWMITDLVRQIHDATLREACLLPSGMGFSFVAAPTSYMDTSGITVESLVEVIRFLKKEMDVVLIDTSPFFDDVVRVAMEHSDQVLLMTSDEPASVKNLRKMTEHLARLSNPQWVTVLNRVSGNGVGILELKEYLPWPLLFSLAEDVNVNKATLCGKCISREQPTHNYSIQLERLVKGWLGDEPMEPPNWLRRLQQQIKQRLKGRGNKHG